MGGDQAARVLTQIQVETLKRKGHPPQPEEEDALYQKIKSRYDDQASPYYAASRLWVDGIIDPLETRKAISLGIEAANHASVEKFNPGVLQT